MAKNIMLSLLLGLTSLVSSGFSLAHSHHEELTPTEKMAEKGIFDNVNVMNRALSDWDGVWQSIYPLAQNGTLDSVFKKKAEKEKKTLKEIKEYYNKGYKTDIELIEIENNRIVFHTPNAVNSCTYSYSGYKILTYKSGKKGVRYLFTCTEPNSKAPKFVQFSDHMIAPKHAKHFHIYMGDKSHDSLLSELSNWPTYYPYQLTNKEIVDEMLHH